MDHVYNLLALTTFVSSCHDSFNCWKRLACLRLLSWLQNTVQTIQIILSTSLLQKIHALTSHLQRSLLFILLPNHCVFCPDLFLILRAVFILYLLWFSSPDMGFILYFELLLSLASTPRSPLSLKPFLKHPQIAPLFIINFYIFLLLWQ